MRIISGIHGGRRISPPANMPYTRPTTDIAKEGLFNILQNNLDIDELKVLDLFGGTGCISYELASRGAPELPLLRKDNKMYDFIKKTSVELNLKILMLLNRMCLGLLKPVSAVRFYFCGSALCIDNY